MSTFFTSDLHLGHANIIKYCNRPFKDVEEMNETIIKNWNSVVMPDDVVYHLGDFAMGVTNKEEYAVRMRERLNGTIHHIMGNHDPKQWRWESYKPKPRFESIKDYDEISVYGHRIVLFHYGMRTWHHDLRGVWQLYGHSHNQLPPFGKSCDVGVDAWNFTPVSFQELQKFMAKRQIGNHPMFHEFGVEVKSV